MSRLIYSKNPETRKLDNNSQKGKLILTSYKERAVSLLLQDGVLTQAQVIDIDDSPKVGEIYVGKVKNVLHNINACFVEIAGGEVCYLPLSEVNTAMIRNRIADGRIVAGDELPVQIKREAIKTKQTAVTTEIELDNEYFVFKAGNPMLGVSNKISKDKEKSIRELLAPKMNSGKDKQPVGMPDYCVIARTNCRNLEPEELLAEYDKAEDAFFRIYHKARHLSCFQCVVKARPPVIDTVQQYRTKDYEEIITDIPAFYEAVSLNLPEIGLRLYEDDQLSLSSLYGLKSKLESAVQPKVWMPSGANLVIEQTECLTAIDVNTGKNIKGKESEETILAVNMEAAKEAALQIRLRNLSGIIIIDFINMKSKENEEKLLEYLRELTGRDPINTSVVDMTPLGLVEITRKKGNKSLREQLS